MNGLYYILYDLSDPRTSKWWLVSSPGLLMAIIALYLHLSLFALPKFMKHRAPFNLKRTIIAYDIFQIILNVWLLYEGLLSGWLYDFSFACQPIDYSNNPQALRLANACWWYLICKLVDLVDTAFFILRKKTSHVTFLHVYHHALMIFSAWMITRYVAGGHCTLTGVINTFVHILMYTYYLLATLGPAYQKQIWWKKYLTQIQIMQFVIVFLHNFQLLFRECTIPSFIITLQILNSALFVYLFGSFYNETYNKSSSGITTEEKEHVLSNKPKDE